jgi:hypothetical protein
MGRSRNLRHSAQNHAKLFRISVTFKPKPRIKMRTNFIQPKKYRHT